MKGSVSEETRLPCRYIGEEVKPKLGIKQDQISTVDSEAGVLSVSPSSEEIENHAELTLC